MDYNGCCELWEHGYEEGGKNGDIIENKIRKLKVFPLKSSSPDMVRFGIYKNEDLTTITISKVPHYECVKDEKPKLSTKYRRLVRIETQHKRKISKGLKEVLECVEFEKIN